MRVMRVAICVVLLAFLSLPIAIISGSTLVDNPIFTRGNMEVSVPITDPDIKKLVYDSIQWFGRYSGLSTDIPMPEIKYASREYMAVLYKISTGIELGDDIRAMYWYYPVQDDVQMIIYLEKGVFDKTNMEHQSKVAHEAFHHVQFLNNVHKKVRCRGQLEQQAYTAHAVWLEARDYQDVTYIAQLRQAARMYRCR